MVSAHVFFPPLGSIAWRPHSRGVGKGKRDIDGMWRSRATFYFPTAYDFRGGEVVVAHLLAVVLEGDREGMVVVFAYTAGRLRS